jgi:SAM-dependent methyltransferase
MSHGITLTTFEFLASPQGERLLAELAQDDLSDSKTLAILARLRKQFDAEQAGAALTMARLRQKAVAKFGEDAQTLFFTPDALEQASDPHIRRYRAQYAAHKTVLDLCCGIGSDALAMAQAGANVTGYDMDEIRIAIARHNAAVLGVSAAFEVRDVMQGIPAGADLIFFDPARRDEQGKRIFDVTQYQPPLSLIQQWQASSIVVKIAPGVDLAQVRDYGSGVEFISVAGDLKEAVLWTGANVPDWARQGAITTRATLITADGIVHHWQRDHEPDVPIAAPRGWLCEPDPAILRAGLVQDVAESHQGALLDETIAYFTTDTKPDSVWLRAWRVLDWMPYNLKKLRAYLRDHHVGRVTVKKRGSPIMPEELIAALKLKSGAETRTLVLTRYQGAPIVLICDDIEIS